MTRVYVDEAARVVTTVFDDGARLDARPQYDTESAARAESLGYGRGSDAIWKMCAQHDKLHHLLAEAQGHPHSIALWFAAHPEQRMSAVEKVMAATEERAVLLLQRALNVPLDELWAEREASQDQEKAA